MASSSTADPAGARAHARAMAGTRVDCMPVVPATAAVDLPLDVQAACVLWDETIAPGGYAAKQLNRGARLVEMLKQAQYSPVEMEEQVAAIFAANGGYLDPLPIEKVKPFEAGLISFLKSKHPDVLKGIKEKNDLTDELKTKLTAAVEEFAKSFI